MVLIGSRSSVGVLKGFEVGMNLGIRGNLMFGLEFFNFSYELAESALVLVVRLIV